MPKANTSTQPRLSTDARPRVQRRVVPFLAALSCVAAVACGCAESPAKPVATNAAQVATALTGAVEAKSEETYSALFAGDEDVGIRHWIWLNMQMLAEVDFQAGDGGALIADWRWDADSRGVSSQVGRIACDAGGCALSDMGPQAGSRAPIWVVQPLQVLGDASVAVFASTGASNGQAWLTAAQAAQRAVAAADLGPVSAAWNGRLAVELPQNASAFAQAVGASSAAAYTTTGALTQAEGPADGDTVPPVAHIVVNPQTTEALTPAQRTLLLTHEAVHVATAAVPVAKDATWVSEGLAENVAVAASPGDAADEAALAKASCTGNGLEPPADGAFGGTDAVAQNNAYAVSQVLVGLIRNHLGSGAAQAIYLLWQDDDAPGVDLAAWSKTWCTG